MNIFARLTAAYCKQKKEINNHVLTRTELNQDRRRAKQIQIERQKYQGAKSFTFAGYTFYSRNKKKDLKIFKY